MYIIFNKISLKNITEATKLVLANQILLLPSNMKNIPQRDIGSEYFVCILTIRLRIVRALHGCCKCNFFIAICDNKSEVHGTVQMD